MDKCWWPHAISQAAFIHNRLAGTTCRHIMSFKLFYSKHPELQQIQHFGCMAYVVLWCSTHSMWLHDHPVVSKHLCPRTLRGTYLGFSNAPSTIKGQKVWLPELNCIVIAKDVCFSKLEQSETNTIPSHAPILARNSKLLHSYTWLPQHEDSDEAEPNDVAPPSILPYSRQRDSRSMSISSDHLCFDCEWDHMMVEIEEAGEVVVDLEAIAADLEVELDVASSEGGAPCTTQHTLILMKFGVDKAWAASTPATETINTLGPQEGDTASAEEVHHYVSLMGSPLWIAQGSRPDITFAVGH